MAGRPDYRPKGGGGGGSYDGAHGVRFVVGVDDVAAGSDAEVF